MVNFSENFDVKFLKKSNSCPKAQQNTLLISSSFELMTFSALSNFAEASLNTPLYISALVLFMMLILVMNFLPEYFIYSTIVRKLYD